MVVLERAFSRSGISGFIAPNAQEPNASLWCGLEACGPGRPRGVAAAGRAGADGSADASDAVMATTRFGTG